MPGVDTVKLFCPNCGDIYAPPSSKYSGLDGEWRECYDGRPVQTRPDIPQSDITASLLPCISCRTLVFSTPLRLLAVSPRLLSQCPVPAVHAVPADPPRRLFRNHLWPIILPNLPRTPRRAILRLPLDLVHPALWRAGLLPLPVPLAYRRRDVCEPESARWAEGRAGEGLRAEDLRVQGL